jgi:hypothetical protein
MMQSFPVIPAKAGIQLFLLRGDCTGSWTPVFAGVTTKGAQVTESVHV